LGEREVIAQTWPEAATPEQYTGELLRLQPQLAGCSLFFYFCGRKDASLFYKMKSLDLFLIETFWGN
jgi:hypothetical protein